MVHGGSLISHNLENISITLNISAFLNVSEQLTKAEVGEWQAVVSIRICFEQVIQLEKKFHQMKNEILLIPHDGTKCGQPVPFISSLCYISFTF